MQDHAAELRRKDAIIQSLEAQSTEARTARGHADAAAAAQSATLMHLLQKARTDLQAAQARIAELEKAAADTEGEGAEHNGAANGATEAHV